MNLIRYWQNEMSASEQRFYMSRPFWAIALCAVCAGLAFGAVHTLHVASPAAPLWALLSMQILPAGTLAVLFSNLKDLKDVEGLNRTERVRLSSIVDKKMIRAVVLICALTFAGLVLALLIYRSSYKQSEFELAMSFGGGLVGLAIYFTGATYFDIKEAADFKTLLLNRAREKGARDAVLATLRGEAPPN